jgi:predicted PurR-regulated permease PerM
MTTLPARSLSTPARIETAAQVLAGFALVVVLQLKLLAALLSGLLIHQLVHLVTPWFRRAGVTLGMGKILALTFLALIIGVPITFGLMELTSAIMRGVEDVAALMQRMADIISTARSQVPAWALEYLPSSTDELQSGAARWLTDNAGLVGLVGQDVGRLLFHILIGMIIGGIVAFQAGGSSEDNGPLAQSLNDRADLLGRAFSNVVFSQVLISALNTTLTAIYLAIFLPLFDIHLPLIKTMIAVTFLAGLLPVIGNLISNTVIVVVSLSLSPLVAAVSLAYLVIIHKLEYFMNARIIGSQIRAKAWELLMVLLVMEASFGIPGVIAGPIFYAYLKNELKARQLI